MRDCRRHTSYYCVKCTRLLDNNHNNDNSTTNSNGPVLTSAIRTTAKRNRVFALCSPLVENNLYCFYRHALELPERTTAEVDQLKALDCSRPKKQQQHFPPPKEKRFRKDNNNNINININHSNNNLSARSITTSSSLPIVSVESAVLIHDADDIHDTSNNDHEETQLDQTTNSD